MMDMFSGWSEEEGMRDEGERVRGLPESDTLEEKGQAPGHAVTPAAYQVERVYSRAYDDRGHARQYRVNVPQDMEPIIEAAWRAVPEYRSAQDLWRDAIVHRIQWIAENYERMDLAAAAAKQVARAEVERVQAELAGDAAYAANVRSALDAAVREGEAMQVAVLVMSARAVEEWVGGRAGEELKREVERAEAWLEGEGKGE